MLDFGIAGKKAVVCASSKGLGFGCADALAASHRRQSGDVRKHGRNPGQCGAIHS